MARALLLAVAVMCGCQRPPTSPESAGEAVRWIHDCAHRQIGDSRAWYDGLPSRMHDWIGWEVEVQSLLATLGSMKTCRLVHDAQGVPVDVVLDEVYWGRAGEVMATESLRSWRMWGAIDLGRCVGSDRGESADQLGIGGSTARRAIGVK